MHEDSSVAREKETFACAVFQRRVPTQVRARLLLEVGFHCPVESTFCDGVGKANLQIHHISEWHRKHVHHEKDMIALCANCHSASHRGLLSTEFVRGIKTRLERAPVRASFNLSEINYLTCLRRQGELNRLDRELASLVQASKRIERFQPLLPQLILERGAIKRKLGQLKAARRLISIFGEHELSLEDPEHAAMFLFSKGCSAFDALEFNTALSLLKQCLDILPDLSNSANITQTLQFQTSWRMSVAARATGRSTDLGQTQVLALESDYPNDHLTATLESLVIHGKGASLSVISRAEEQVIGALAEPIPVVAGIEVHTVAELCHLLTIVEDSRGRLASASRFEKERNRLFGKAGMAKHSKVFELR